MDFLSEKIKLALIRCRINHVNELRIRNLRPIMVNVLGKDMYLCENGYTDNVKLALIADENEASDTIIKASEYSLYAVNENLKNGFISIKNGIRIGVCGEIVMNGEQVTTCKNITSISIRFAKDVKNCSKIILDKLNLINNLSSIAIVSPPGGGKTTIIRDLARETSNKYNVIIIDERYEIASQNGVCYNFDVGNSDVYSGGNKELCIKNAVRSCSPDVVITDEISTNDYSILHYAKSCGINVFATIHAKNIQDIGIKQGLDMIIKDKIFDYFVLLSNRNSPGKITNIYDNEFNII